MERPTTAELVSLAVAASPPGTPAAQGKLVNALAEFLFIVGTFVRMGASAPAMVKAFDDGVEALKLAAAAAEGAR